MVKVKYEKGIDIHLKGREVAATIRVNEGKIENDSVSVTRSLRKKGSD